MSELLAGVELVLQNGEKVNGGEYLKGKMVGLYFSAGYCPPCRAFTPKLKRFYEAIKESNPNFEIVFIPKDKEEEDMVEYFNDHQGEWTAIPFGSPKIQELLQKYEVVTIPSMRIVKPDGSVIVADARTEIQERGSDPEELYESWAAFYEM